MTKEEATLRNIQPGSVVQIAPETEGFFPACLMTVTEVKGWGVQGFVLIPQTRTEKPGVAYYRAAWEEIEFVGTAVWTQPSAEEE